MSAAINRLRYSLMESIASLFIFAAIAAFTPGPNNIMIMSSGLNYGVKASLPHLLGICLGFPSMMLAVGLGLGYFFERYPMLHSSVQIIGVLYLIYLAWLIAVSSPYTSNKQQPQPLTFIQAALFQWVNPKAWVMGTSALAAYTVVGAQMASQVVIVVSVFMLMAFPSAGVWLLFGKGLQALLSQPSRIRRFNYVMSALLIMSIVPVVFGLLESVAG